jgi:hypothetical protein
MRVTLISIQKPHTDNIFIHKKKTVEWRKAPLPKGPALCYETKNKGGVILSMTERFSKAEAYTDDC